MKGFPLVALIALSFITILSAQKSQISSELWSKYFLGEINHISYPYDEQSNIIITSSQEGYIHLLDLSNSFISYRKLLNGQNNYVTANRKNILALNLDENSVNVFDTKGGQFSLNLENSKNTNPHIESVLIKKTKNLNFFISKERLRVFNTEKVLYDSKVKEKVEYYDIYVNEEKEKIYFVSLNNNTIGLYELPTTKISKAVPELVKSLNYHDKVDKAVLTKSKIYLITGNKITSFDYTNEKTENIKTDLILSQAKIIAHKGEDSIVIKTDKAVEIIPKNKKSFLVKKAYDKCIIASNKVICFVQNKNIIHYTTYDLLSPEKKEESQITLDSFDKIKCISVSSHNPTIMTISIGKGIYQYEKNKLKYSFENTFSSIVFSQLIAYSPSSMKIEDEINQESQYYTTFESLKQKDFSAVVRNFVHLIINDLIEIGNSLKTFILDIIHQVQDKNFLNQLKDFKNENLFEYSEQSVKQSLFIYTQNNELFVLDGLNGDIIFSNKVSDDMILYKINMKHQREKVIRRKNDLIVELLFTKKGIEGKTFVYNYNLVKNTLEKGNEINNDKYSFKQAIASLEQKLIKSNDKSSYINVSKNLKNENQKLLLDLNNRYTIEQYENSIYAFRYSLNEKNELIMSIAYNLKFENIISYSYPDISNHPNPAYLVGGKIYYKFINENLIVILSKKKKKNLLITIVQGESGKILDEIVLSNIEFTSLSYLFEDNWGMISYIKKEKGFKRNEIFAFELMKQEIEYSLTNLLQKHFKSLSGSSITDLIENDITILSQTFVLERHVKKMFKSNSELNNANKFIILLFENSKVYLIDRRSFSPRRPLMKDVKGKPTFDPSMNSIYVDQELPGYQALVGINHKFVLDAGLRMNDIKDVLVSPTENESTFVMCSIGVDVKCYVVYPDKVYDRFSTVFMKYLIAVFTSVSLAIIVVIRRYVKKMEYKNKFINESN